LVVARAPVELLSKAIEGLGVCGKATKENVLALLLFLPGALVVLSLRLLAMS